jgi:hypothetical protein
MSESSSSGGKAGGILGLIITVFTMLAQIWGSIPQESREKLIGTLVEGFDGLLRRFFRRYHELEAKPGQSGQEVAP